MAKEIIDKGEFGICSCSSVHYLLQVRTLSSQVRLDARTKLLNPKWYEGMLSSGYEGVREIQKRLTNTMGWSATSGQVIRIHTQVQNCNIECMMYFPCLINSQEHVMHCCVCIMCVLKCKLLVPCMTILAVNTLQSKAFNHFILTTSSLLQYQCSFLPLYWKSNQVLCMQCEFDQLLPTKFFAKAVVYLVYYYVMLSSRSISIIFLSIFYCGELNSSCSRFSRNNEDAIN